MNLIVFLGSGVSRASGLPLADELTEVMLGSSALPLAEDSLHPRMRTGELRRRIESLLRIMADFDTRDAMRTNALFRGRTSWQRRDRDVRLWLGDAARDIERFLFDAAPVDKAP